ncbi:ABC transporter permease [Aquipuribacter hungaricus]|uniref:ABC transporter permease n=1 Tax=Aquipuribacter hungaricus TaxID=545624 RepID=A0ABV7WHP1_9MICO
MSATLAQAPAPQAPSGAHLVAPRRSWRQPVVLWVMGLLALAAFGLGSPGGTSSTFGLSAAGQAVQLPDLPLPTRPTALVLALVGLAVAAVVTWLVKERRPVSVWWSVLFGVAFAVAFLVWAVADKQISFVSLLQGSVFLATPLVFGALGGVLCERAGVVNIAIEGQLLAGAFLSAVVASLVGGGAGVYVGLLAAPLAGLFFGWLLAVFAIRYVVDQVVLGVVINVLVVGLTSFLYGQVLVQDGDRWNQPGRLPRVPVPGLSEIPVLGPVLFNQSIVVYLMYAAVVVLHVALFRTRWGLRVRAVGEHPKAADTAGIDVNKVRFRNVLMGGAMAGLGGAFFTVGSVGAFGEEMTAGQGFIALAALIFGRWSPLGALVAALLFGVAGNLASVLSIIGSPLPGPLLLMAPYLATLFAVAGLVGKVRAPAADGVPYKP